VADWQSALVGFARPPVDEQRGAGTRACRVETSGLRTPAGHLDALLSLEHGVGTNADTALNSACATVILLVLLTACARPKAALPDFGAVPEFQLTAETGQPFDSKILKGNIWVADFMFTTCPGPCPRMTSQMHEIQQATTVKLVSFTVDPARDTPQTLAAYSQTHHAAPERWSFLTGPQQTLNHLGLDVFKLTRVDGSLQHSTRFLLIDRKSRIRGYYDTSEHEAIQKLIGDIHLLEGESI
jgi:protein SCO1/2